MNMEERDFSPGRGMRLGSSESRLQINEEEDWKRAGGWVHMGSKSECFQWPLVG